MTGIVLGVLIFVIVVVVAIVVIVRRRSGNSSETSESTEAPGSATEMDSSDYEDMGHYRGGGASDPFDDSIELEASSSHDMRRSSQCSDPSCSDEFMKEEIGIVDNESSSILDSPGKTDRNLSNVLEKQETDAHHETDRRWTGGTSERTDSETSIDTCEDAFDSD